MRRNASLPTVLATIMFSQAASAQQATGNWSGVLKVTPATRLRLVVHIATGADGRLAGTLDSFDQGAMGLPLTDVVMLDGRLAFRLVTPAASFEGGWDAVAEGWRGEWRQLGRSVPLTLTAGLSPSRSAPSLPADWRLPTGAETAALIDARIAARPGEGIVVGLIDSSGRRIVARGPANAAPFDGRTIFEIGQCRRCSPR